MRQSGGNDTQNKWSISGRRWPPGRPMRRDSLTMVIELVFPIVCDCRPYLDYYSGHHHGKGVSTTPKQLHEQTRHHKQQPIADQVDRAKNRRHAPVGGCCTLSSVVCLIERSIKPDDRRRDGGGGLLSVALRKRRATTGGRADGKRRRVQTRARNFRPQSTTHFGTSGPTTAQHTPTPSLASSPSPSSSSRSHDTLIRDGDGTECKQTTTRSGAQRVRRLNPSSRSADQPAARACRREARAGARPLVAWPLHRW